MSISGEDAASTIVSYLIDRGHTRIGMISGQVATPPRESRVRGYRQALAEHHVPLEEVLIRGGDFTEAGGYEAARNATRENLLRRKHEELVAALVADLRSRAHVRVLHDVGGRRGGPNPPAVGDGP